MRRLEWLVPRWVSPRRMENVQAQLRGLGLNTVCEGALCPNIGECFASGTATFMILGDTCTRSCGFCAVKKGAPAALDPAEPERLAEAVSRLNLRHAVVTSVTRDDLPDGGASHFSRTIRAIKERCPGTTVEVLVPDFGGSEAALATVLEAGPEVLNHNMETVPRLYYQVRPRASYPVSLRLLERAKGLHPAVRTKSGLMLGLGETEPEVIQVMSDLVAAGCDYLTLGQYLRPSRNHLRVAEYLRPEAFDRYKRIALEMGFRGVKSGPLVRSSFHAADLLGLE